MDIGGPQKRKRATATETHDANIKRAHSDTNTVSSASQITTSAVSAQSQLSLGSNPIEIAKGVLPGFIEEAQDTSDQSIRKIYQNMLQELGIEITFEQIKKPVEEGSYRNFMPQQNLSSQSQPQHLGAHGMTPTSDQNIGTYSRASTSTQSPYQNFLESNKGTIILFIKESPNYKNESLNTIAMRVCKRIEQGGSGRIPVQEMETFLEKMDLKNL